MNPNQPQTETKKKIEDETMAHRFTEIKPKHYVTEDQVQKMIDDAITRHNRNASIISFWVGWFVLALFAEGLLRLIGVIPPLAPWLDISLKHVFGLIS